MLVFSFLFVYALFGFEVGGNKSKYTVVDIECHLIWVV